MTRIYTNLNNGIHKWFGFHLISFLAMLLFLLVRWLFTRFDPIWFATMFSALVVAYAISFRKQFQYSLHSIHIEGDLIRIEFFKYWKQKSISSQIGDIKIELKCKWVPKYQPNASSKVKHDLSIQCRGATIHLHTDIIEIAKLI